MKQIALDFVIAQTNKKPTDKEPKVGKKRNRNPEENGFVEEVKAFTKQNNGNPIESPKPKNLN